MWLELDSSRNQSLQDWKKKCVQDCVLWKPVKRALLHSDWLPQLRRGRVGSRSKGWRWVGLGVGLGIRGRSWVSVGVCKVGGVGSGSDSSPWISCSAVRTEVDLISTSPHRPTKRAALAGCILSFTVYGCIQSNTAEAFWVPLWRRERGSVWKKLN